MAPRLTIELRSVYDLTLKSLHSDAKKTVIRELIVRIAGHNLFSVAGAVAAVAQLA